MCIMEDLSTSYRHPASFLPPPMQKVAPCEAEKDANAPHVREYSEVNVAILEANVPKRRLILTYGGFLPSKHPGKGTIFCCACSLGRAHPKDVKMCMFLRKAHPKDVKMCMFLRMQDEISTLTLIPPILRM